MSITTALRARRELLRDREAGFTLIELLVVVIIIGILAAIAIPVYIGVQNNAKDSATQSNLANDKIAVNAAASANNGTWTPIAPSGADNAAAAVNSAGAGGFGNYGWVSTTAVNDTKTGTQSATNWCIKEVSATQTTFYVTPVDAPTKTINSSLCA